MSKSSLYGSHHRSHSAHTAAMIEYATRIRSIRRSKIAFWTVGSTLAIATSVVASAITAPWRAAIIGILTGAVAGFLFALGLFCWPAVRVLWHWAFETLAFTAILTGYLLLTSVLPWPVALGLLILIVVGPFTLPSLRRRLWAWVMCAVTRHRLRVCFAAFIASQRTGMTPLILLARPTPAGERVWIWLRPGLALADLEQRLDRLAAGCWASECRIAPGSRRYAALLRLDIARRNPLVAMVGSPLPGLIPTSPAEATFTDLPRSPLGGLDLPDTPEHPPAMPEPKRRVKALTAMPDSPAPVLDDILGTADAGSARGDDDLSNWI